MTNSERDSLGVSRFWVSNIALQKGHPKTRLQSVSMPGRWRLPIGETAPRPGGYRKYTNRCGRCSTLRGAGKSPPRGYRQPYGPTPCHYQRKDLTLRKQTLGQSLGCLITHQVSVSHQVSSCIISLRRLYQNSIYTTENTEICLLSRHSVLNCGSRVQCGSCFELAGRSVNWPLSDGEMVAAG